MAQISARSSAVSIAWIASLRRASCSAQIRAEAHRLLRIEDPRASRYAAAVPARQA